jgi:hypothetical protein
MAWPRLSRREVGLLNFIEGVAPIYDLTLRSRATRGVSKGGPQTRCSFPPFETPLRGLLRVRCLRSPKNKKGARGCLALQ